MASSDQNKGSEQSGPDKSGKSAKSGKSGKPGKLGKLKAAARSHLDLPPEEELEEQPTGEQAAANRPPADMRGFMQSMAQDQAEPADPTPASAAQPEPASSEPTADSAFAVESGSSIRETVTSEALIEVDSDEVPAAESASSAGPPDADAEIELPKRAAPTGYPESPAHTSDSSETAAAPQPRSPSNSRSKRSMPKTRDSIYNVSSDIRLEDYTEGGGSGSGGGGGGRSGALATAAKIGGVLLILGMLAWGGQQLMLWIDAPDYRITVANEMIDAASTVAASDGAAVATVLSSAAPVHIRFDWAAGDLTTDFLRIEILQAASGQVEAAQERRPPVTANYVYFLGPLDPGAYRIRVLDRDRDLLIERDFRVN